jgi:F-type H+-transporting ATPase subunit b
LDNILNIDPKVVLIQIFGFVLLMLIFKKFFFGPIGQVLEDRKNTIAEGYAAADRAKAEMENLRKEYVDRLTAIEAEGAEKIQTAVKEAQAVRDEIVGEARAKAEAVVERGTQELERERQKAIAELREEVANLAIGASSKLLERSLDDKAHRKLIDDFISSVEASK